MTNETTNKRTIPLVDIIPRTKRMVARPAGIDRLIVISVIAGILDGLTLCLLLPAITSLASGAAVWGLGTTGWLWVLAGLAVIGFYIVYLQNDRGYGVALDMLRNLHRLVGDQVSRQPLGWFARPVAGRLSRIVSSELMMAGEILAHSMAPMISRISATAIVLVVSWVWNWRLGLILTIAAPVFVIIILCSTSLLKKARQIHEPEEVVLADRIVEYARCQGALRATGRSQDFVPLRDAMEKARSAKLRALGWESLGLLLSGAFTQGVIVVLIAVTSTLAISGTLQPIPALAFIGLALRFTTDLSGITESAMALESRRPLLDALDEVLTATPLPEPADNAPETRPGEIAVEDVTFTYPGASRPAVKGLTFTVPANTMTALVGPSGCGKTTVARLISRFHDVDSGEVRVSGVPVTQQTSRALMSQLSMVFQDVYLFDDSLWANIAIGRDDASEADILDAARTAGVEEIAARLPEGWGTQVGEGGRALSGGERQRVAIARALLKRAPIVLLDEATSALDVENEANVVAAVDKLRDTSTVLVIAHKLDTIRRAGQIVSLTPDGEIEAVGTHEQLLASGGTYARFWGHLQDARGWQIISEE